MWPLHIFLNKLLNGGYNVHEDDVNLDESNNFKSAFRNEKKGKKDLSIQSHFIDVSLFTDLLILIKKLHFLVVSYSYVHNIV